MTDRRRGLGRGLGALIPSAVPAQDGATPGAVTAAPPPYGADAGAAGRLVTRPAPRAPADRRGAEHRLGDIVRQPDGHGADTVAEAAEALISEVPGATFAEIPLDEIVPNPRQPREVFDEDAMAELAASIREVGLLQPVVVRRIGPASYELIMGERRWRAAREAELARVPAIVRDTADDRLLLDALLENLHRSQLNPLEEAAAYDQLLKDFACTHEVLADRVGKSRSQVSNTLRLLKLPPSVQRRVAAGVLSAGHARALLALEDPTEQERLATRIVAEGLSVRAAEEIVAIGEKSKAPRRPRAGRRISPALHEIATQLSDRFETRVRVDLGQKRGKIVVEFASMEDLERIVNAMAPDRPHVGIGVVAQSGSPEQNGA